MVFYLFYLLWIRQLWFRPIRPWSEVPKVDRLFAYRFVLEFISIGSNLSRRI